MSKVDKIRELPTTIKNGAKFAVFRREGFENGEDFDKNLQTYHIRILEAANRIPKHPSTPFEIKSPFICDVIAGIQRYNCVQIVARKNHPLSVKLICWGETEDFVTGTAFVNASNKLPEYLLFKTPPGSFREQLQGISINLSLFSFAEADYFHLAYLRHNMGVITRHIQRSYEVFSNSSSSLYTY